jgi:rod shape-determining protein MreC
MLRRRLTLLALTLLIFFLPTRFSAWLRDRTIHVVTPVGSYFIRHNTRLTGIWENIHNVPHLLQDRTALQQEVISLQQQLSDGATIAQENIVLRSELGVTGVSQQRKKVLARVVVRSNDPSDTTFTINVGTTQGVAVGQPAVIQGFLIGRVLSVQANSAVIRAITSSQSRVQVWIASSREKGLLVGDGVSVSLGDINQGVAVPNLSLVETSGLGETLPQGILVGTTSDALSKPSDANQRFVVTIPHDPSTSESLFILLDTL